MLRDDDWHYRNVKLIGWTSSERVVSISITVVICVKHILRLVYENIEFGFEFEADAINVVRAVARLSICPFSDVNIL